jgi:hypothetical protein
VGEATRARRIEALAVAGGLHAARRQELIEALAGLDGEYSVAALDAAREAAYRYIVAASELRGFRWALRQALEEDEIAAIEREATRRWAEIVASQEEAGPFWPPLGRPATGTPNVA